MSDNDTRHAFLDRAAVVLDQAIICIRNLLCQTGQEKMAGDLADAIHNLPAMFYRWNDFEYENTRRSLEWFEKKHFGKVGRFSRCLDLSDEELELYRNPGSMCLPEEAKLAMAATAS